MSKCPLCQSASIKYFHTLNSYKYFQCFNCITLFLNPIPNKEEISAYYSRNFKYPAGESNEQLIRKRAKIILKKLKELLPDGKNLLDIGSGYGYFLNEANKMGMTSSGIEPAKNLYENSLRHSSNSKIYNLTFSKFIAKNNKEKFDFITLIHTIEHVINPNLVINNALKLLKPKGILYIETPNLDSHLFRAEKYSYTFLTPPDHIWILSRFSFMNILAKLKGIKIEVISSFSQPEHLMGILKRNLSHPNLKQQKSPQELRLKEPDEIKIKGIAANIKFIFFDKILAPLLTPLLNVGIYGSTLELYIKKK